MAVSSGKIIDVMRTARGLNLFGSAHQRAAGVAIVLALLLAGCSAEDPAGDEPQQPATSIVTNTASENGPVAGGESFEPLPSLDSDDGTTLESNGPLPAETHQAKPEIPLPGSETKHRLPDDRPEINSARLQAAGIQQYRSERLLLLSDLPAEKVSRLPELADALFNRLEQHFGTLPPATDGSKFQVTGCLIDDEARFRGAGLMPGEQFSFDHGRHRNYQFWMFDQEQDYYRRHLLLHEFTHCFMTCESGMNDIPPLWYIEGMAEYFATHRLPQNKQPPLGSTAFGILPHSYSGFDGWGRISELRRLASVPTDAGNLSIEPLPNVMPTTVNVFRSDAQYARSWCLCWLLQSHPVYQKAFAPLAGCRTRDEFLDVLATISADIKHRLAIDWLLVRESLQEGFDTDRSFPIHATAPLQPLNATAVPTAIQAAAGWQQVPVRLQRDQMVVVECSGKFQVNATLQPWISEPQGVSIEYVRHRPLGCVLAVFVSEAADRISSPQSVGVRADLTAPFDGTLWLQVNDHSHSRTDNDGEVSVVVNQGGESPQ
jgi:hypothetical protein